MTDKKVKVKTDPKDLWLEDTVDDKQLIEQLRVEFDSLAKKYNELQEKQEGLQTHNEYQKEQIDGLQKAVKILDDALKAKPLVDVVRNPNKGFWVKFDLSNVELTRPLINLVMRMKDRPKEFYIEVLGDDVIEVSETRLS